MGIWNRVKNIVSSNTHELLDQLENPTQSLNPNHSRSGKRN